MTPESIKRFIAMESKKKKAPTTEPIGETGPAAKKAKPSSATEAADADDKGEADDEPTVPAPPATRKTKSKYVEVYAQDGTKLHLIEAVKRGGRPGAYQDAVSMKGEYYRRCGFLCTSDEKGFKPLTDEYFSPAKGVGARDFKTWCKACYAQYRRDDYGKKNKTSPKKTRNSASVRPSPSPPVDKAPSPTAPPGRAARVAMAARQAQSLPVVLSDTAEVDGVMVVSELPTPSKPATGVPSASAAAATPPPPALSLPFQSEVKKQSVLVATPSMPVSEIKQGMDAVLKALQADIDMEKLKTSVLEGYTKAFDLVEKSRKDLEAQRKTNADIEQKIKEMLLKANTAAGVARMDVSE